MSVPFTRLGVAEFAEDSYRASGGRSLEWLAVVHAAVVLIANTWAFGGQADFVRVPLTTLAALGIGITLAVVLRAASAGRPLRWALWWCLPVVLINAVVLLAAQNPSFRPMSIGGDILLANTGGRPHWPSSALPDRAWHALREFDVLWLTAFNLALAVRRRRLIRAFLAIAVVNAVALAVFGTVQRLGGAKGIYFNAIATPQPYFFASFVYHNHWGAFSLLMLGATAGMAWHFLRRRRSRDPLHSPATGLGLALLLIAATIPLSGSRSSSALMLVFLVGGLGHALATAVRQRRAHGESLAPPLVAVGIAVVLAAAGIWYVAKDMVAARFELTRRQIAEVQGNGRSGFRSRVAVYKDTWEMARAKPWFGWGMGSYPYVFGLYNTQHSVDRLPVYYHDAHSDWIQAVAEHGVVGTFLFICCAAVPLVLIGRKAWCTPISAYLLSGCALVLLYASLEFPFGNYAVISTWWLCFFAALHYGRLTAADLQRESESSA